MKNLLPQCEKPAIILNPNLKDLVLTNRNYVLNNNVVTLKTISKWYMDFPYSKFSKIKHTLQPDDLPNYYILVKGEKIPMFMCVGCGKCILCREKKAKEWCTRAMCESQTSMSLPVFFTLTYNDINIPEEGVSKEHCQKFMKRFRINLERYCGHKCNVRYFLCAEYGSETHRPHYHGILWNLPLLEKKHLVYLIQKSWSYMVDKQTWDTVPFTLDKHGDPVYKYKDINDNKLRILYGYITCSECNEGRVKYAMKYMKKDAVVPKGKNPVFFLSSRRGGIGSEWIEHHLNLYRNNPQLMDVKVRDIWSEEMYCGVLPQYFKNKIAPSNSTLIKKSIRDKFKLWNYYNNKFHSHIGFSYTPNQSVLDKYPTLHYHHTILPLDVLKHNHLQFVNYEDQAQYTRDLAKILDYLEQELLKYTYDVNLARSAPIYKKKHLEFVEKFIETQPMQSVSDKAFAIRKQRMRSRKMETYI